MMIDCVNNTKGSLIHILLEQCVYAFSLWTISSHIATYLHLNLYDLLGIFSALYAFFLWLQYSRRMFFFGKEDECVWSEDACTVSYSSPNILLLLLFVEIAIVISFFYTTNTLIFWSGTILNFGISTYYICKNSVLTDVQAHRSTISTGELGVWILGFCFAIITLISHRVERDDVNYHSTAAYIADNPSETLFSIDPKHPAERFAYLFVPHKAESLLLLASAASIITKVTVSSFFHLWLTGVAGFFCVVAHWRLLRLLTPQHWVYSLFAVELVYLAFGETPRAWGLYGYPRLHEGKSIFVALFTPLLIAYGMELGAAFSWRRLLRFSAAQIAAVGMTSTALWAGPCIGFLALAAGAPQWRSEYKRIAISCLAFVYPLLIGLLVMRETIASPFRDYLLSREAIAVYYPENINIHLLDYAFIMLFKWTPLTFFSLFSFLASWAFAPTRLARRFCVVYGGLFMLLVLNPIFIELVGRITCPLNYWRLMWMLPLPFYLVLVLVAPITKPFATTRLVATFLVLSIALVAWGGFDLSFMDFVAAKKNELLHTRHAAIIWALCILFIPFFFVKTRDESTKNWCRICCFITLLLSFYVILPGQYALSTRSSVEIKMPGLRVQEGPYAVAQAMAREAGPSDMVLAPEEVALWLVTLSQHPSPLLTVKYWDLLLVHVLPQEDVAQRRWLSEYVGGRAPKDTDRFAQDLQRYKLKVVCFNTEAPAWEEAKKILKQQKFTKASALEGYEIWVRLLFPYPFTLDAHQN